jgi:hypothetical protein
VVVGDAGDPGTGHGRTNHARKRRRLRSLLMPVAVVAAVACGIAVASDVDGGAGDAWATTASLRGSTVNFERGASLRVTVTGEGVRTALDASRDGTFVLRGLVPGTYAVRWDDESSVGASGIPGVDIGTASRSGVVTTRLARGVNSVSITVPLR